MSDPKGRISPRARRLLRETLLTGAALAGVICLLAAIAAIGFQVRPLIFRSGSMSPAMSTGSLALARTVPATDLSPGDVVSVTNAGGIRITHRVVSIDNTRPVAILILRGDANTIVDAETYPVAEVDRVFFSVPGLGYVLGWLSHPSAVFTGGVLLGALATLAFSSSRHDGSRPPNRLGRATGRTAPPRPRGNRPAVHKARGTAWLVAVPVAGLTLSMLDPARIGTEAAFTDTGTTRTGTLSALTVPAPVMACSVASSRYVTVSWPAVAGATSYTVVYTPTNQATQTVTINATSYRIDSGTSGVGGNGVVRTNINYGSTTWTSADSNRRYYNGASTCS